MLIEPLINKTLVTMSVRTSIGLVLPLNELGNLMVATLAFTIFGLLMFALAYGIIVKVTPFSIRKELEEDQNVALAVVIGAVILGVALIVAAAVHG